MNRATRPSRPGLTGSSRQSLLLARAGGIVLEASPSSTTAIDLRWTDGDVKEDGFKIERSTDGVSFSQIATVGSGVLSYNDTGLTESVEYYYRVREYLGADDYPYSNIASTWTVPATPTTLTATAVSGTQINLAWTDVSTGNTGYVIEGRRPPTTGAYSVIGTAGATATTFSATGLITGTAYEFRVAATNPATQSSYSNAATATTQALPAAPTGVSASASTTAVAVTITWTDASTDEDNFNVYRNTSNTTVGATLLNSPLAGIQTYTDNATNNPSAPPAIGTTYYYWVSASNGVGESAKTAASQNATGGVTTLNVPAAPTSLTATATSSTQINLAWTDNATNETGYIVERRSPAGSGSYSQITSLAAGSTTFNNTGLTASTQYEYRVAATNAAGNSSYSNAASATTQSGSSTYNVTYLVVAGAGSGGYNRGGGGGAGGYRNSYASETSGGGSSTESPLSLTSGTTYTVTVGAGGAGGVDGSDGNNSVFGSITSTGGGEGGVGPNGNGAATGATGGSGGGGGSTAVSGTQNGGNGTANQGYGGGLGRTDASTYRTGGGGGGAGGAGGDAPTAATPGGAAGAGLASSITASSITRAAGGIGGRTGTAAANGGANTGTGGDGGQNNANGGNGGSGVVIIRMATANYSGTTTGSPTVTTSGSDTILTYNASGTYTA